MESVIFSDFSGDASVPSPETDLQAEKLGMCLHCNESTPQAALKSRVNFILPAQAHLPEQPGLHCAGARTGCPPTPLSCLVGFCSPRCPVLLQLQTSLSPQTPSLVPLTAVQHWQPCRSSSAQRVQLVPEESC